jgi:hypothetical protein
LVAKKLGTKNCILLEIAILIFFLENFCVFKKSFKFLIFHGEFFCLEKIRKIEKIKIKK